MAELLLEWAELDGVHDWREMAERIVSQVGEAIAQYPPALGHVAGVADARVNGTTQVAVVGDPSDPRFKDLVASAGSVFIPALVMAGGDPATEDQPSLMRDRSAPGGVPTAYVCRAFACELPTTDPRTVEQQVKSLVGDGSAAAPQRQA